MTETKYFEIFDKENTLLLNNNNDPDKIFFENDSFKFNYYSIEELSCFINASQNTFSALTLNIRSMSKNFENFKEMLKDISHEFTVICLLETWCKDENTINSNFQLKGYKALHQTRSKGTGGGICFYIHNTIQFKKVESLSLLNANCELFTVELTNQGKANAYITGLY